MEEVRAYALPTQWVRAYGRWESRKNNFAQGNGPGRPGADSPEQCDKALCADGYFIVLIAIAASADRKGIRTVMWSAAMDMSR